MRYLTFNDNLFGVSDKNYLALLERVIAEGALHPAMLFEYGKPHGSVMGVSGMDADEARQLLDELKVSESEKAVGREAKKADKQAEKLKAKAAALLKKAEELKAAKTPEPAPAEPQADLGDEQPAAVEA